MKLSLDWLSQYVEFKLSPRELADTLTMAGLEVEEMETVGAVPDGVVTAKILSRRKHENSDHLSICEVDNGSEVLQIVCGAPNCDAGNIVPLAMIGTVFQDGDGQFTIKKGKIRGVESFGMMCSARELGLGNDHSGLMILPPETKLGLPMKELVKADTVYTVEITPNRPDWLSHWGVARDVSALCGGELRFPDFSETAKLDAPKTDLVTVEACDLCPQYTGRVIRGVKVGESPEWMKKALNAVGIRPINNIVDITNYVMMELGVPLHAFDRRFLKDGKIVVRRAKDTESIVALDGKTYPLSSAMLVIADTEKPVAIAGVMGGEYSGILPDTTEVVLESAFFDPASIRATSKKLGLSSDASYRYERGVDPEMVIPAGLRALQLILELAGGDYTAYGEAGAEEKAPPRRIKAEFKRIRSLLGMDVTNREIIHILAGLGFLPSEPTEESCVFTVPSWRAADVSGVADLAEEVARIHGLDKLPDLPIRAIHADFADDACSIFQKLRGQLTAAGLDECVSNSMMDEKSATQDGFFQAQDLIRMNNPISLDLAVMRPSLLPGMLANVKRNIARKNTDLALFEIGRVFCADSGKFPEERDELVIALTGRRHPERFSTERSELMDFFDLKGILESVAEIRRLENVTFAPAEDPRFVKGACAELLIDGKRAGFLGEIADSLSRGMHLQTPLYIAVIQLPALLNAKEKSAYYLPISQFPATTRDVAFLAPLSMENKTVIDFIRKAHLPNLESVELFDIFADSSLGKDRKSMAYTLIFRSPERTLTDAEVNKAHEKLRAKLQKELGVELR